MKTFQAIAREVSTYKDASSMPFQKMRAVNQSRQLTASHLPDLGTLLCVDESRPDKLVFSCSYRHKCGRKSHHYVKVRPEGMTGAVSVQVTGSPGLEDTRALIKKRFQECLEREIG